MAIRETRADRGRRRGRAIVRDLVGQLVDARVAASVSQETLASLVGCSQSEMSRMERIVRPDDISIVRVARIAAVLGLELSAQLHLAGDPIRDKGHQALAARFRALLSDSWSTAAEVPFPILGDLRAWDLVLRGGGQVVGVELETRIRDLQRAVRRVHLRQRDGGVDVVLIVVARSTHNRAVVGQLREMLGREYETSPRVILAALREGRPLPGSAVILL
jgi:transcriptional regulator with XRE-family HTH domain